MNDPCIYCGNDKKEEWDEYTKYFECACPDSKKKLAIERKIRELQRQIPKPRFRSERRWVLTRIED